MLLKDHCKLNYQPYISDLECVLTECDIHTSKFTVKDLNFCVFTNDSTLIKFDLPLIQRLWITIFSSK